MNFFVANIHKHNEEIYTEFTSDQIIKMYFTEEMYKRFLFWMNSNYHLS